MFKWNPNSGISGGIELIMAYKSKNAWFIPGFIFLIMVLLTLYGVYQIVPVVRIGDNTVNLSIYDLKRYVRVRKMIADVTAIYPFKSDEDCMAYLVSLYIQNEILKKAGVEYNLKALRSTIEKQNRQYMGLLRKIQNFLEDGEDGYDKLFVIPQGVPYLFYKFYSKKEIENATEILKYAQGNGIVKTAEKYGLETSKITLDKKVFNKKELKPGTVLDRIIENKNGFMIMQVEKIDKSRVNTVSINIPRKPIGEFMKEMAKKFRIKVLLTPYSFILPSRVKEKIKTYLTN